MTKPYRNPRAVKLAFEVHVNQINFNYCMSTVMICNVTQRRQLGITNITASSTAHDWSSTHFGFGTGRNFVLLNQPITTFKIYS